MSDLENNAQEKGTKKRPYNLREKKEKLCIKKKCLTFVKSKGLTLWLFRF